MKKISIDEYILQNYKTKTNAEMAEECGCNRSTISNHRKKLGISASELNKQLRNNTEYICKQYGKKTKTALAKELSCSPSFIGKIWTENGLQGKSTNIYSYNEKYFEIIDNPQKAYWLGFIASDGNIYRREGHKGLLSLSLKDNDIEILHFLKKDLNTEKPISIVEDKRRKDTKMAILQISSDLLCNQLLEIGIGVRKTFDLSINQICSNIPKEFISSFILGYFDGDGSISIPNNGISKSHVRISGPITVLEDFQKILKNFDISCSILRDKRKYTKPFGSLEFQNTSEKYIFLKFIYSLKVKCLERKKERADELIKRIEDNSTNRSENINAQKIYKSVVLKWEELLERWNANQQPSLMRPFLKHRKVQRLIGEQRKQ